MAVVALMLLPGCASPVPVGPESIAAAGLDGVAAVYRRAVDQALSREDEQWHAGALGNLRVHAGGAHDLGLCFEWQWLVFEAVEPRLNGTRWIATGIAAHHGTFREHHAVLVYPVGYAIEAFAATAPGRSDLYVLDPWRYGRADIFTLGQWANRREIESGAVYVEAITVGWDTPPPRM